MEPHLVFSGMSPEGWGRWEQKPSWSYKCQEAHRGPLRKYNVGCLQTLCQLVFSSDLSLLSCLSYSDCGQSLRDSVVCSLSLLTPFSPVHCLYCAFNKDGSPTDFIFIPAWLYLNFNSKLILAILGIKPNVCYTSRMWTVDLWSCLDLVLILFLSPCKLKHSVGQLPKQICIHVSIYIIDFYHDSYVSQLRGCHNYLVSLFKLVIELVKNRLPTVAL